MNHQGTMTLTTERLTLRRFELGDAEAMYANWASDERVTRFLTWQPHGSVVETRRILAQWVAASADLTFYQWAIVPDDLGKPIGSISVVSWDEAISQAEIGYCIGHAWWGRGYMPEALAAVIDFLFEVVGVSRIQSQHDPDNPASGRVMAKCGMHLEGVRRAGMRSNRGITDACVYSLLACDQDVPGTRTPADLSQVSRQDGTEPVADALSQTRRTTRDDQDVPYQDLNSVTIDRWVAEGWEWGRPIDHATFARACAGEWSVKLTPTKPVPAAWLGSLCGKRVLGLASGGGQQGPLFAAAGAQVTILDNSEAQLASERSVAEREGYDIALVRADMTRGLPFADASFDLVFNPVSICYIREVEPLWREVARVLAPGGVLLTGFDTIVNYLCDTAEERIVWSHPFDPLANPAARASLEADDAGMQFGHDLSETLGGLLRSGLSIVDLYEDTNGEGRLHALDIPTYVALRAVHRP